MSYLRGAQSRTHSPGDEHSGRRTRYEEEGSSTGRGE